MCNPTSAVSSESPAQTSAHSLSSISSYTEISSESPEATSSCDAYSCNPPSYSDKTVTETKHHPKTTTYTVSHTIKPTVSTASETISYESDALRTGTSSSEVHSPCGPSTKHPTYTFPNGSHPTSEPWYSGKPTGSMILTTSSSVSHPNTTSSNSFSIVITTGKVSPTRLSSDSQQPSLSTDEEDAPESTSTTDDESPTETEPPSSSTSDDDSPEETESALPASTGGDDATSTWRTSTLPKSSKTMISISAAPTTMQTSHRESSISSAQGPPEYSDPPSYSYKGRRRM